MKRSRVLVGGFLLLVSYGCPAVYVEEPIGDQPVKLAAEDWNGTWITSDAALTIVVQDSLNGVLRVAGIETTDDGELVLATMTAYVREADGETLISLNEDEEAAKGRFYWGILVRKDDQLVFFEPEAAKFRELIESGKLPGSSGCTDGSWSCDVYLGPLEPAHLTMIVSGEEGFLFDWHEPFILTRVRP